jgi:hypothetical protein
MSVFGEMSVQAILYAFLGDGQGGDAMNKANQGSQRGRLGSRPPLVVTVNTLVVLAPVLSVAVTVICAEPAPVGVPLMVKVLVAGDGGVIVKPGASVPVTE